MEIEKNQNNHEDQPLHKTSGLSFSPSVSEFFKLYEYKLKVFRSDKVFKLIAEKYWALLTKNFNGEIDKKEFIKLFAKIYKLILPLHNYEEIYLFIENEWNLFSMNKPTMNLNLFQKYLFRIAHIWCVHVNKREYESFLNYIYERLIKYQRFMPSN